MAELIYDEFIEKAKEKSTILMTKNKDESQSKSIALRPTFYLN